ncbi:MAG: site-2 protease family protein [Candidatus Dojkabacteria bacterium]
MFSILINILLFVLIIGFLTFIHELGHFLAAKAIRTKVYEFSLGFGPKLISKKYGETLYCIRIIPLGGFVKILGDGDPGKDKDEEILKDSEYNLNNKPKGLQMMVMLAGVFMNLLFAVIFYYVILGFSGWRTNPLFANLEEINMVGVSVERVIAYEAISDESADIAGVPEYGIIKQINGEDIDDRDALTKIIKESEDVSLFICDDQLNDCKEYVVNSNEEGKIGVYIAYGYILDYSDVKPLGGILYLVNNLKIVSNLLRDMIGVAKKTGDYTELSNTVSGPVGIFLIIDNFKSKGFVVLLSLVADLSLSLAIMNLLPIPALDGGRVLILLIESIFRKDLNEKVKSLIINISFVLLMILVVLVIIKDFINIEVMKSMLG